MKTASLEAFVKDGAGGNTAGVVLDADGLSDQRMLEVARRLGHPETAFHLKSDRADYRLRFFTPTEEVDLCGHATIAAAALLWREGRLNKSVCVQETKAGLLAVELGENGVVLMDQPLPVYGESIAALDAADALGVKPEALVGLPRVVSTGLRDLLVELKDREALMFLRPDFARLSAFSGTLDVVGLHVFTREAIHKDAVAHCRNFAPRFGIDEEAATGTSNGALACHLFERGLVKAGQALVIEQGYGMGRPSEIRARLSEARGKVSRVQVGGKVGPARWTTAD